MLEINNITAITKDTNKEILKDLSLKISDGEVHAIMGPNGTGKSTLSKVIMGNYKYKLTNGDILFDNKSIINLSVDERAKLGIFLAMQDPTVIDGVTNSEFLKTATTEITGERINYFDFIKGIEKSLSDLELNEDMIHRPLNKGFSGGEKKKNEILQLKMLKPKFIILDEIDSGLDVDSLKVVCKNINDYINENKDTSLLIITHYPRILEYIKPDYVHVMSDGNIKKTGDINLAFETEKKGYSSINDVKGKNSNE